MKENSLKERAAMEARLDVPYFSMIYDTVPKGEEKPPKEVITFIENHKKGFSSSELMKNVLVNIPVSAMLEEWLGSVKSRETKRKYNKAIEHIFSLPPLSDLIEKNCAITTLDKNWGATVGVYNLIEELNIPKSMMLVCQRVYSRFCDFIRITTLGIVDPEESPKQKEDYYAAKAIYNEINWNEFINSIQEPFNLIAEMTYLAAKKCEYRLRVVHSKKNIFSLDSSQINFKKNTISFKAEQSYHLADILGSPLCIPFPEDFMRRLEAYLGKRKGVVFLSSKGKHLYSIQAQRAFKKASEKLPYVITPVLLGWAGVLAYKEEKSKKAPLA